MAKPTNAERKAAIRVLKAYTSKANKLLKVTDQEAPYRWASALEECIVLLKNDPDSVMDDYLAEYKAGHED